MTEDMKKIRDEAAKKYSDPFAGDKRLVVRFDYMAGWNESAKHMESEIDRQLCKMAMENEARELKLIQEVDYFKKIHKIDMELCSQLMGENANLRAGLKIIRSGILPNGDHVSLCVIEYVNDVLESRTESKPG